MTSSSTDLILQPSPSTSSFRAYVKPPPPEELISNPEFSLSPRVSHTSFPSFTGPTVLSDQRQTESQAENGEWYAKQQEYLLE